MIVSCRRPGCSRKAQVCITYDAVACQVWLDPLEMAPGGGQPMCLDHAGKLNPPKGWVVLDRRASQAELVTSAAEPASAPTAHTQRRRFRRGWGQFDELPLDFARATAVVASPPAPSPVVEASPVVPPSPVVGPPPVEEAPPIVEPAADREPVGVTEVAVEAPVLDDVAAEPESPSRPVRRRPAKQDRAASQDTAAMLKPKGRLLSRAFESAGPQRSVLTDGLGIDPETAEPVADAAPVADTAD